MVASKILGFQKNLAHTKRAIHKLYNEKDYKDLQKETMEFYLIQLNSIELK